MKKLIIYSFTIVALCFFLDSYCDAANESQGGFMNGAQSEFAQAQKELDQAAREFEKEADQVSRGWQQNGQTSWSQASTATPESQQAPQRQATPAESALQGSPETGYAGTWTDPANGDVVTTIIAPKPPVQNSQNYPIIVEPQVNGYGGQSPYTGWSNWPTSPDNPGYPSSWPGAGQNPPYNQPPPPGWHPYYPGQPYPGFNPYPYPYPQPYPGYGHGSWGGQPMLPPGPGSNPPPFNPNYRPLRPAQGNNGSLWQPGMTPAFPGGQPPQPGQPGGVPGNPSQGWRPPQANNPAPSVPSLPLAPAGQGWNRPAQPSGGGGGLFSPRGRN